jgi:NADH-quinone oxidoreductase subunit N
MRVFYVGAGCRSLGLAASDGDHRGLDYGSRLDLAITQTDVKRMLAYSSIAHAGFMMTAFVGRRRPSRAVSRAR